MSGEDWASVGGRGFRLDPAHPLAKSEWLAVADIQGAASGARILSAVATDWPTIEALFGGRIESGTQVRFDPEAGGVRAETGRRLGAILLSKGQDSRVSGTDIAAALVEGVREHGLEVITWPASVVRVSFPDSGPVYKPCFFLVFRLAGACVGSSGQL